MTHRNHYIFKTLLSATLSGALFAIGGIFQPVKAIQFQAPGDVAPRNSAGGGVRGSVQFAAPGDIAPRNSAGGGTRGGVKFAPPGDAAPANSAGGGVRGNINFSPPGDSTLRNSAGGGTRGDVRFTAPVDSTPAETSGGGSRDIGFQPPGDSTPTNTASGGVRTDRQPVLTAVLPNSRYGRTVAARPTFFVYLPPTASEYVFFSLQDEYRKHHYQTVLKVSGKGGIVGFTLPEDAPPLEIGKNYVWFFAPIPPGGILRPDNVGVIGWVRRVEPIDTSATASPIQQATQYAQSGIWYDTLATLATAVRTQPDNATLTKEWRDLLKQVGLEAIASQPISEHL
jgi:Domain of Unknown Function (DUF928)